MVNLIINDRILLYPRVDHRRFPSIVSDRLHWDFGIIVGIAIACKFKRGRPPL